MYKIKLLTCALWLSLSPCTSQGMESRKLPSPELSPRTEKDKEKELIEPYHTIDLFNVKKNLHQDKKRLATLISCNLALTPSKKNLIIGAKKGNVYMLSLSSLAPTIANGGFRRLFKHPEAQDSPILTVAPKNNPFIIASAGNYEDTDFGEFRSTLKIYKQDGWALERVFDWPISALKFNTTGNLLVIGGNASVNVLDVDNNSVISTYFSPAISGQPIKDISITPHEINDPYIIAITHKGTMQFNKISYDSMRGYTFSKYPDLHCDKTLPHIHCPNVDTIMAQKQHHGIKLMSTTEALKAMSKDQPRTIPSQNFVTTQKYEQITFNTGFHIASAHWTKNNEASPEKLHTIKIFLMKTATDEQLEPQLEQYTLTCPIVNDTYRLLVAGRVEEKREHIFNVVFHDNYVVAFLSCGKMLVWKLPKDSFSQEQRSTEQNYFDSPRRITRQRSKSAVNATDQHNTSELSAKPKHKSSDRLRHAFTRSTPDQQESNCRAAFTHSSPDHHEKGSKKVWQTLSSGTPFACGDIKRPLTHPNSPSPRPTSHKNTHSAPSSRPMTPKDSPKRHIRTTSKSPRPDTSPPKSSGSLSPKNSFHKISPREEKK